MEFNLDQFLPFRLSRLTNLISRRLASYYEDEFELSRTQWRILAQLWAGPTTAQSIADKAVMDKSVISRAVRALIDRGLIKRMASQEDGRRAPLALTKKGRETAQKIIERVRAEETKMLETMTPQQRKQLSALLTLLSGCFD